VTAAARGKEALGEINVGNTLRNNPSGHGPSVPQSARRPERQTLQCSRVGPCAAIELPPGYCRRGRYRSPWQHYPGLTRTTFRSRADSWKKGQQEQKISQFEFVTQPPPSNVPKMEPKIPAGVYTNLISTRKLPVPPTVLLVDGLNTDVDTGMQARPADGEDAGLDPSRYSRRVFLPARVWSCCRALPKTQTSCAWRRRKPCHWTAQLRRPGRPRRSQ